MSAASIADALMATSKRHGVATLPRGFQIRVGSWKLDFGSFYRRKVNFVMPEMADPQGQSIEPLAGRAVARTRT
jgi:hypothetical protein